MMSATTLEITAISKTHATVGDRQISWDTLIRAATQDRVSTEADHRGNPMSPNGEHELASTYRALLATALPLIREAESAAYQAYCQSGATTREGGLAGHGSWVSGPSAALQSGYRVWEILRGRIEAVIG